MKLEMRQVDPRIPSCVLDECEHLRGERALMGELGPPSARNGDELERLLGGEILSESDMGMVRKRLLVVQRTGVHHLMHLDQLVMAAADAEVHHVRRGKDLYLADLDFKRSKIGKQSASRVNGELWGSGERSRRQNGDVGMGSTPGNQLAPQIIQKLAKARGKVGN